MYTEPLIPTSVKAMKAIELVAKILQDVPEEEWLFVLKHAQVRGRGKKIILEKRNLLKEINKFLSWR